MRKHDGSDLMKFADHLAKGNGWSMGQMKVTRADGSVEYRFSAPQFHLFNLKGWLWYWTHKRDLINRRTA
jgi:hypothetical protein